EPEILITFRPVAPIGKGLSAPNLDYIGAVVGREKPARQHSVRCGPIEREKPGRHCVVDPAVERPQTIDRAVDPYAAKAAEQLNSEHVAQRLYGQVSRQHCLEMWKLAQVSVQRGARQVIDLPVGIMLPPRGAAGLNKVGRVRPAL